MAIVYLHRRLDIEDEFKNVFYVGIGKSEKRAYSKIARNKYWHNIVNKFGYKVQITHNNICWDEACSIEKYLISFYREILGSKLCNLNNGGNGNVGYVLTELDKKKISATGKISQNKPEVREKRIQSLKRYYQDKNNIEKNRQRQILAYSTDEAKERNRIRQLKPEVIAKKREAARIRYSSEEYRKKHGEKQKIAQNKSEVREKRKQSLLVAQNKPEVKKKRSESLKKYFRIKKQKMNNPKVVGICCTYGRFKCVERVINCFIQQTYQNKELIVFNTDTDSPYNTNDEGMAYKNVRFINCSIDMVTNQPYTNVGAIRRDALTFITDEFCYVWHADDDDIYLPHYITQGVDRMKETGLPFFKPMQSFFYCGGNLRLVKNTMEASVLCDVNKLREYGYALNTALEGLAWYTKARDNKELNESDSYCLPSYCFNWNDGAEMDAPHKQSGSPDNPQNFNNHKAASKDAVNGRFVQIFSEEKMREIYKPYFDFIRSNESDFPQDLVQKYFKRYH